MVKDGQRWSRMVKDGQGWSGMVKDVVSIAWSFIIVLLTN